MSKKRSVEPKFPEASSGGPPIVPPAPPITVEADRQDVYDRSIAEFESDGVRDAESGGHDPERNFVEPEPKGERRDPKR